MEDAAGHPRADYNLKYVWLISLVAAMGGLLFGYDWVVIGGAKPFFEPYFNLTRASLRGWANSCALLGCLAGAILSGGLSDKFGRKRLLIAAARRLRRFVRADGLGDGLRGLRRLADPRRSGHRHGLEPVADVHRRGRPRPSCGDGWWPSTS